MDRKLNWLIYTGPYDKNLGSSVILHNIAKFLSELGDIVVTTSKSPFENIRHLSNDLLKTMEKKDWIVILTETVDNVENFPNVVRWILYNPGGFLGYKGFFHPNEYIVQYGKSFTINTKFENCQEMTNLVFDLDYWVNLNMERENTNLILFKKGGHFLYKESINLTGRILDDEEINDEVLLEAFNKHEKFITYDNETFHSIQAAVCGAISIVIPNGRLTEQEWRVSNPIRKWGIAYGYTPEQIKFAIETKHLLIDEIKKQIKNGESQILEMRKNVQKKFPNQYHITCVIETEWKNMNIVNQIKKYKLDNKINQIILLDRNKKNRPDFIDFTGIEIIETNLDRIPSIEHGIDESINDLVMVISDKLSFELTELTKFLIENKHKIGFMTILKENYLYEHMKLGMQKIKNIDFESSKILDNIFIIRKSEYIKSPNLKKYGLTVWCDKIYKNKYFIFFKSKIDGLEINELENIKQDIDIKILEKFL